MKPTDINKYRKRSTPKLRVNTTTGRVTSASYAPPVRCIAQQLERIEHLMAAIKDLDERLKV